MQTPLPPTNSNIWSYKLLSLDLAWLLLATFGIQLYPLLQYIYMCVCVCVIDGWGCSNYRVPSFVSTSIQNNNNIIELHKTLHYQ